MAMRTLATGLAGRRNNFDFIRLVAAIMVIFSHSWPLTQGSNRHEPLAVFTHNQLDFGALAVYIFFIISGFLIAMSYDRTRNLGRFVKARVLRIVPALLVVIVVLSCVLGPIDTTQSAGAYWSQFPFLSFIGDFLPGVFAHNIYHGAVDGSLWTIKFEVLCYGLVALAGLAGVLTNRWVLVGLFLFAMTAWGEQYSLGLLPYFSVGMLAYGFRSHIPVRGGIALGVLACLVIAFVLGQAHWVLPVGLGYLVLWFAFNPRIPFHNVSKYGDWSYGLYIWAFPVQQCWASVFDNHLSPSELFGLSVPIAWGLAILSWNLIEKRALALKNVPFRWWRRVASQAA